MTIPSVYSVRRLAIAKKTSARDRLEVQCLFKPIAKMKEQWKKLDDNDAKLLVDVEEGRQLPIKINIPLTALTPPRDEFCCNRLLTVLRVFVLLALLALIGWTGMSLYSTNYVKSYPEQSNLENSFAFQSQVYQKKDDVQTAELKKSNPEDEEFRDSTKKALDLIATQMKGFNERLDHMQDKKEQHRTVMVGAEPLDIITNQMNRNNERLDHLQDEKEQHGTVTVGAKPIYREFGASESSDSTLDSMFDELAEKVGLADTEKSGDVIVEYKPELNAIVLTDPVVETEIKKQQEPIFDEAFYLAKLHERTLEEEEPPIGGYDYDYIIPSAPVEIKPELNAVVLTGPVVETKSEKQNDPLFDEAFFSAGLQERTFEPVIISDRAEDLFPDWEESLNEDAALDTIIRSSISETEQAQKEYSEMWDRFFTNNAHIDEIHEEPVIISDRAEDLFPEMEERLNKDAALDTIIRSSISETEQAQKEYSEMWDRFASNSAHIDESHEEDKQVDQIIQAMIEKIAESDNRENDNDSEPKEENVENNAEDKQTEESDEGMGEKIVRELIVEPLEYLFGDPEDEVPKEDVSSGSSVFENVEESNVEDKAEKEMVEENNQDFEEDDVLTQLVKETLGEFLALDVAEDETEKETDEKTEGGVVDYLEGFFSPAEEEYDDMQHKLPAMSSERFLEEKTPVQQEKSLIEMVPDVEYVKKIQGNPVIPRLAKMLEPIVGQNHELLIWYYTHKDLPEFVKGADKWKVFAAKLLYDSDIKDYPADATIVLGLAFEKVLGVAEYPASNEEVQSDLQQEIINRLILKSYLNKMLLEGNAEAETLSQVIKQHNEEKLQQLDIIPQELTYTGDPYEVNDADNDDLVIPVVRFDPFVDDSAEANEQRTQVLKAFKKTYSQDFFDTINYKAQGQTVEDSSTKAPKISEESEAVEQFTETTDSDTTSGASEEELPSTSQKSEEVDMNEYLYSYGDPYDW